jgi:hypothetical protein
MCKNVDGLLNTLKFVHKMGGPYVGVNPLLSIMLQGAWDLNVPCQPKRSKALFL